MRIVLDTNVLVSELIASATPPGQLVDAWKAGRFTLVSSREQLVELRRVLAQPKILNYIRPHQGRLLVETIVATADLVRDDLLLVDYSPDDDDNRIIATALAGQAGILVSGDHSDLIGLKPIAGLEILTPRGALRRLERGG